MKKEIIPYALHVLVFMLIVVCFILPCFAYEVPMETNDIPRHYGFSFDSVAYEWGYGNTFYRNKVTDTSAFVMTSEDIGGSVFPSQNFNTRLGKATSSGNPIFVGHKWACRPDCTEIIPYDTIGLKGSRIRAEFSLRNAGYPASIHGGWAPDLP